MISQLETQKRNLESSLLFMQQEHSNTLKALHDEISKLQKRCTELTFELTMQNFGKDEADTEDKQRRIGELECLLKDSNEKHKILNDESLSKDLLIADLKRQLKHNEKKFLEELRRKNQQVLALKVEVDDKGGTIAYLTTELHKLKLIHRGNAMASTGSASVSEDQTGTNTIIGKHKPDMDSEAPISTPVSPPSVEQSTKRRSRRPSASEIRSRPVSGKGNKPHPDAEVFLARAVAIDPEPESVAVKPTPPVLPPITPGGEEISKKAFGRRQQLLRRRLELKSQPQYNKLAVDTIASSGNTWVNESDTTTK